MRWLVEVTSIGKSDTQSFCIDADSWQKALQSTRSQRGDSSPMSGFSIELLEDGYRAVDPLARLRYVVRRAPDDAALTAAPAAPAAPAPVPAPVPSSAPTRPVVDPQILPASTIPDLVAAAPINSDIEPESKPPAPLPPAPTSSSPGAGGPPRPAPKSKAATLAFSSKGAAELVEQAVTAANAKTANAPAAPASNGTTTKSVPPPAPAAAKPQTPQAPAVQPAPKPPVPTAPAPVPAQQAPQAVQAGPIDQRISAVPPTQPAAQAPAPAPGPRVLLSREQDPTAQSPLSYREYAYWVAPGTSEPDAEALLRAELERVKQRLASVKAGKLVNLAAFDVEFQGKPPVAPIAALTWKDWKNETQVIFPRRRGPSVPPASAQQPQPPSQAPASFVAAQAAAAPPAAPGAKQALLSKTDPMANAPPLPAPGAPIQAAAPQGAPVQNASMQNAPTQAGPAQAAPAQAAPQTFEAHRFTPGDGVPAVEPKRSPSHPSHPPPATATAQRLAEVGQMAVRPSSGRFMAVSHHKGRVSGDELLTALFEAMHDLHFLRDSLEGGDFCLQLANDMIPSHAGVVHSFDMNTREYVVTSVAGANARGLLARRQPESDPILGAAMRARRAVVVPDAARSDAAGLERYRAVGGPKSIIVAPVMWGGRALGAIELVNPLDDAPFREEEGHAMSYIAEQFAEFIGSHGLVVEKEKILARGK